MRNTDCRDAERTADGCMAIAELVYEQLRMDVEHRGLKAGRCAICGSDLAAAWTVVSRETFKEWEFAPNSKEALKCDNDEFDPDRFMAFAEYYCPIVKERWCPISDGLPWFKEGPEHWSEDWRGRKRPTMMNLGWWLKGVTPFSPVDVAFAMKDFREFQMRMDVAGSDAPKGRAPLEAMA